MNILYFLEELNLDRSLITDPDRLTITYSYEPDQWIKVCNIFLVNLDRTHKVPGKTVYNLTDICNQFRHTGKISLSQRLYITNNLIDYWDQLSCESRAQLLPY